LHVAGGGKSEGIGSFIAISEGRITGEGRINQRIGKTTNSG